MSISVLTLVKNRAAHLQRLIEGLQRSERIPDELIVVNMDGDWSPPDRVGFPIRVIPMPSAELPLARARNAAAKAASSPVLLFLDVDCIPRRGLVGLMEDRVQSQDGLVCAEVRYLQARDWHSGWTEESLWPESRPHPVRNFPESGCRTELNAGLFWSLLFGVRRTRFFDLGGFDEKFLGYGAEDTDFGFRAQAHGMPLFFLGGTGAFHQYHAVYDPPLQHLRDIVRNAQTFQRKWKSWPMTGWLDRFEAAGLIKTTRDSIIVLRAPTAQELRDAKIDGPF